MQLKPRENELTIKTPWKVIKLYYRQATAYECLEFQEKMRDEEFNIVAWLYDFINTHAQRSLFSRIFRRKALSKKDFRHIANELDKVARKVIYSRFKWGFDENAKKTEWEEDEEGTELTTNAYIYMVWEVTHGDPFKALKKYTFEQINDLVEWFTYYNNLKTEEWRKANTMKIQAEKYKKIDKDAVRNQIKKLEEYQKERMKWQEGTFTK